METGKRQGLRLHSWETDDPLADVFLMQFGQYPSTDEVHFDYRGFLNKVSDAKELVINPASHLPGNLFELPVTPLSAVRSGTPL